MELENPLFIDVPKGYPFDTDHRPDYENPTTRNRVATVIYELADLAPTRRSPSGAPSRAEQLALSAGLWVAEQVHDQVAAVDRPAEMRPGVIRLGQLAFLRFPGGVILQDLTDLGEAVVQAAVVRLFAARSLPIAVASGNRNPGRCLLTKSHVALLTEKGGGHAKVRDVEEALIAEARRETDTWIQERHDLGFYVGSGQPRGWEQACDLAQCLRLDGSSQRAVQTRLNLDGYLNARGARCWHPHNTRRAGGWSSH